MKTFNLVKEQVTYFNHFTWYQIIHSNVIKQYNLEEISDEFRFYCGIDFIDFSSENVIVNLFEKLKSFKILNDYIKNHSIINPTITQMIQISKDLNLKYTWNTETVFYSVFKDYHLQKVERKFQEGIESNVNNYSLEQLYNLQLFR